VARRGAHHLAQSDDPVLLDVTRLIARSWTGRHATGIDRVCLAYLRHFRARAQAVVQHRGLIRVLGHEESADLFHLLEGDAPAVRRRIARQLSAALVGRPARDALAGRAYLNIGHTDFDLAAHHLWIRRQHVRPFYFLHDLIPVLNPEFSRPHAVRRHLGRVESALAEAAGIILGSQAVAHDLTGFAAARGLPLPPLAVAHLAGEALARPAPAAPANPAPYFLCIGTIEPRKNHRLLLALWQRLAARLGTNTPRLVIAGQTGPMTGDILAPLAADPVLAAHVEHRSACCDAELASLMHHARAVLLPTLAEGFGLPFVEALQAGTPVIASDLPVFREIGQGAACLIDPADGDAWEQALLAALAQPDRRTSGFVPPHWPAHFLVVERFIADTAEASRPSNVRPSSARPSSERVLAA
jgi:glycosyltransferase involved in cell wall biosynthesis